MANSFPSLPALLLSELTYQVAFPASIRNLASPSPLVLAGPSVTQAGLSVDGWWVDYLFSAPGTFGSFDQAAAEAALANCLNLIATAIASVLGIPAADITPQIVVTRTWRWSDGARGSAIWTDTWAWNG